MQSEDGKITTCATAQCNWRCCEFQQGNYIVLYPGELGAAEASGQSTAHLKITDENYHGGQKAVCTARDTATCDGGLKPLDCLSYPFFPAPPGGGDVALLLKGEKCPLVAEHHQDHAEKVRVAWNELMSRNPAVGPWLDHVRLVGYMEPERPAAPPELVHLRAVA